MSGDNDYAAGAADALELARVVSNLPGGRAEIERLALEVGFSASPDEIINREETSMAITARNGRAVKALRTAEEGLQYATAGAEQARREVAKWEAAIVEAGERVDRARADVLREHAAALRQRAEQRRSQAEQAGDATEDVPITSFSPAMGSRTTLTRQRVADRVAAEAVAIDARADQLEATARGFEDVLLGLRALEREEPPRAVPAHALPDWRAEQARKVERRRAGVDSLRQSLATAVAQILEED